MHQPITIHCLGESRGNSILKEAEEHLNSSVYTEENLKFTFDCFVTIHRSDFNDMLSIPGYAVPNGGTRARKLILNIKSNNPKLLATIASIKTSVAL